MANLEEKPTETRADSEVQAQSWMDKPLTRRDLMALGVGTLIAYRAYEPAKSLVIDILDTSKSPSEATIEYVGELCDSPETIPWPYRDRMKDMKSLLLSKNHEYHAEMAELTSLETEEALYALELAADFDELMEAFEVYTSQFGARTTLAKNWKLPKLSDEEREAYYGGESDAAILRNGLVGLIQGSSKIPLEVFKLSGIKEIHFTEYLDPIEMANDEDVGVSAQALMDNGKVSFSLDSIFRNRVGQKTFAHEIGHLIDGALSGSGYAAHLDQSFRSLNNPDFEYNNDLAASGQMNDPGLIESYSGRNVAEDKAVIFEEMLSGVNFSYANSIDGIVRKKYRFQLARLEERIPNIAPYLVAIGHREYWGA